jgi:hypothetical protein
MASCVLAAVFCCAVAAAASGTPLAMSVNTTDGTFTLSVGASAWLRGGDIAVHSNGAIFSVSNAGLTLASAKTETGSDALGAYFAYDLTWNVGSGGATFFYTIIRDYTSGGVPAIIFEQA